MSTRTSLVASIVLIVFVAWVGLHHLHSAVTISHSLRSAHAQQQKTEVDARAVVGAKTGPQVVETAGVPPGSETFVSWYPSDVGGESDRWKPQFVSSCTPSMPRAWAPCLKAHAPNLELAEEVIYPDFTLQIPNFISEDERRLWLKVHKWRIGGNATHGIYANQHGQNLMFTDTEYNNNPKPAVWQPNECMLKGVTIDQFVRNGTAPRNPHIPHVEYAAFISTPFDWSFTHFLDRVGHMLAQAEAILVRHSGMSLLGSKPRVQSVEEMWATMPMLKDNKRVDPAPLHADHLLFPCRTPLVHPYGSLRPIDQLFSAHGLNRTAVPLEDRKTVFILSRKGPGVEGGGKSRTVVNEDVMIAAIEQLLVKRGKGEEVKVFDHTRDCKGQLKPCMELFSRTALALVGGHGSAFGNLRFCGQHTLVVEVIPHLPHEDWTYDYWWEESGVFNMSYWYTHGQQMSPGGSMHADVAAIVNILDKHLGVAQPPVLQPLYWQWDMGRNQI